MRSEDVQNTAMWSYLSPEARVPPDHPLRSLRELVNVALRKLSPDFDKMYSPNGRPSKVAKLVQAYLEAEVDELLGVTSTHRRRRLLVRKDVISASMTAWRLNSQAQSTLVQPDGSCDMIPCVHVAHLIN